MAVMVRAEILLCVTLAAAGAFLLFGLRRGRGPGSDGVGARASAPVRSMPDGAAVPVTADSDAPPVISRRPANPLPMVPRSGDTVPAPTTARSGVNNSRFARFDRSGRPASMGSPYLPAQGPATR